MQWDRVRVTAMRWASSSKLRTVLLRPFDNKDTGKGTCARRSNPQLGAKDTTAASKEISQMMSVKSRAMLVADRRCYTSAALCSRQLTSVAKL